MTLADDKTLVARFWAKVDKGPDCWIWTAARNPYRGDYGIFWVRNADRQPGQPKGVTLLAHRVSWEIATCSPPGDLLVLHRCDNPPCVRPDHLFLGTDLDNQADMIIKGRRATPGRLLSDADIAAIRALQGIRSHRQIAREFGIDQSTVSRLFNGKTRTPSR